MVQPGIVDAAEAGERRHRHDQARPECRGLQRQAFDAARGRRFALGDAVRVAAPGLVGKAGEQHVDARAVGPDARGGGAAGGGGGERPFAQVQDGLAAAAQQTPRIALAAGECGEREAGRERARLAFGARGHGKAVAAQRVVQAPVVTLAVQEGGDATELGAKAAQERSRQAIGLGARAPDEDRQAAGVELGDQAGAAGGAVEQAPGAVERGSLQPRIGQQQRAIQA